MRAQVLVAMITVALSAILAVAAASWREPQDTSSRTGDAEAFQLVLDRLVAGEHYYPAMHSVLLEEGYGTGSVFNWRTPVHLSTMAALPSTMWFRIVLAGFAIVAVAALCARLRKDAGGGPAALTAALLSMSLAGQVAPQAVLFGEVVAGCLILASVAAYGAGHRWPGMLIGLAALFVRELSAVYVVVCLLLALRRRDRVEILAWLGGLALYAVYFAWHYASVLGQRSAGEPVYPDGWLQFGGVRFVVETAQFNGLFMLVPLWVTAALLPIALLGLAVAPGHQRAFLAVTGYCIAFAFVGKPDNFYWGAMYTPLLILGIPWAFLAFRDITLRAEVARVTA